MAETDISICARALVSLGARPITSFLASEGDNAVTCANIYPTLKLGLLGRHPWRFLMKKAELTRDATDPIGEWTKSFVIPGDALGLGHAVFSSQSDTVSNQEFEVFGRRIYTNHERLFLDYKADLIEALWPAHFIDMMAHVVAAEIAFVVTDQQSKAEAAGVKAYGFPSEKGLGGALGAALAADAQSNASTGFQLDTFTTARFGGGFH